MARKNALRERVTSTIASAGLGTVKSKPVEPDKIYCFQQVVWQTDKVLADGSSHVRLYIDGHGYKHFLREWIPVEAARLYSYNEDIWLIPGERLALELSNNQATTTVEIDISGYWTDQAEGMA